MVDHQTVDLDSASVLWLRTAALAVPWLATSAILIANYGVFVLPVVLVIAWFGGDQHSAPRRRHAIVAGCLAAAVAICIGLVLERALARPRPFVALGFVPLVEHAADSSFPSDHTLFGVALVTPLAWTLRPGGLLILIWALLVGAARVVAGLHYPSDILGSVGLALVLDAIAVSVTSPLLVALPAGARSLLGVDPG